MEEEKTRGSAVAYVFGPFRLVPDECRLLREGEPVPLTPQAFDLLRLLVESAGHLRSRDELIAALWPTTVVEENSLPWNISAVRKALGDDSEAPRYIETVRGCGYRFIAPVEVLGAGEPGKVSRHRHWPWVAAAGVVAAAIVAIAVVVPRTRYFGRSPTTTNTSRRPSIAVLPFENLNVNKKDAYFVAGMQDLILTKLADIGGLKVISRTSTADYKSRPDNLKTIARQLGVTTILEGSVQKQGGQVLIDVQLIDTRTGAHIWAQSYQRTLDDVFGVEGEVAEKIATALNAKLSPSEAERLATALTNDPAANDLYLRAEYYLNNAISSVNPAPFLRRAIPLYRQALARAPEFALAHARLSYAYSGLVFNSSGGEDLKQLTADAYAQAEQAMKLAPNLAESHLAIGYYEHYCKSNYDAALRAFAAALQIRPNDADVYAARAFVLRRQGQFHKAIQAFERALALNPRSAVVTSSLGQTYMAINRYPQAEQVLQQAIALDPDNEFAQLAYADSILYRTGDVSRALTTLQGNSANIDVYRAKFLALQRKYSAAIVLVEGTPDKSVFSFLNLESTEPKNLILGDLYRWSGDRTRARTYYAKALPEMRAQLRALATQPLNVADVWDAIADAELGLGDTDAGIAAIKTSPTVGEKFRDHFYGPGTALYAAYAYAQAKRADEAVSLISHALSTHGIGAVYSPVMLWLDPEWDPIRHDPHFQTLLKKYAQYKPASATTVAPTSTASNRRIGRSRMTE